MKIKIFALLLTFFILSPFTLYASNPREIQFDNAVNRASRNAASQLDIESRQQAAAARELRNIRANTFDKEESDALNVQIVAAQVESARLARESNRTRIVADLRLRNYLANIRAAELQIQLLEQTIELQERALEHTELRRQHGMASDVNVREATHTLEQSRLNLESVQLNLLNERQSLNRHIGQLITTNVQIVYDVNDIDPIPEDAGSERFVNAILARDPNLLNARGEVEARHTAWQSQLDNPDVINQYMRVQHQIAVFERDMAERQAEQHIRTALLEWERLLEQYEAIQADLAQAQQEYETLKSRFEAGFVTQIQVDQVALEVINQEIALANHYYSFWIARLRIDHPYVR